MGSDYIVCLRIWGGALCGALTCLSALACSPPPPLVHFQGLGADGKYHRVYDPKGYAFRGVVIGPATSKDGRGQDGRPVEGIRVRVLESMTLLTSAGAEHEIFVTTIREADCSGSYLVPYSLPEGEKFLFVSRYLTLGDWELKNLMPGM